MIGLQQRATGCGCGAPAAGVAHSSPPPRTALGGNCSWTAAKDVRIVGCVNAAEACSIDRMVLAAVDQRSASCLCGAVWVPSCAPSASARSA